jgi:hypothetical protein
VADAKAFFASLRTNIKSWTASSQNGDLRNSLDTMRSDFDTAVAPLDQSLADWVVVSGRGIKLYNAFVQNRATDIAVGDINDPSSLGACTLFKDTSATLAMTAADIGSVTPKSVACTMTKKVLASSERPAASIARYDRDQISRIITLVPAGSANFSYTSSTQREVMEYQKDANGAPYNATSLGSSQIGGSATGTVLYTMSGNSVTSAAINGYMPARVDDAGAALTDFEAWNIDFGTTPEADGIVKYTLSGKIDARKNGASLGAVSLGNTSFVRATTANGKYRVTEGLLSISVTAGTSTANGTLYLNKFAVDRNGNRYLPTNIEFTGNFSNTRSESFKGTLKVQATNYKEVDSVAPQSPTNFVTGSVSFSGELKITGLHPLAVTFAARATGYKTDEYNATYSDGANFISFDGNNSLPHAIIIASSTGIRMKWVDGAAFLDVFKNNSKVALLNVGTKVINYVDGSFETLN